MIEGRHAECGGAIIRRNIDAPWPEGSFLEVSDLWQRRWFYVTAPRGSKWAAAPAFRPGPPPQLASWANVGLNWGPANDVPILQSRIQELLERDISLVKIIQVMLVRRACRANFDLSGCGSSIQRAHEPFITSSA